jgi:dCMP deaminase
MAIDKTKSDYWKSIRPNWHEHFLEIAITVAKRSSCRYIHTGTVIVKNKRIIATGYNGRAPSFKENCLEDMCEKDRRGVIGKNSRSCLGGHAETNALLQPTVESKENATLYTVYSPCYSCAKQIAAAKISEVIYYKKYEDEFDDVEQYFQRAGISLKQVRLNKRKLRKGTNAIIDNDTL